MTSAQCPCGDRRPARRRINQSFGTTMYYSCTILMTDVLFTTLTQSYHSPLTFTST
uniref:(California timema) hypothetical protein n=1 Tax=Timema californicum TaxID=61474 RepID=A0A7R9P2M4_TIMCA|nr:unnamed protein product [Timema californicum]